MANLVLFWFFGFLFSFNYQKTSCPSNPVPNVSFQNLLLSWRLSTFYVYVLFYIQGLDFYCVASVLVGFGKVVRVFNANL